MNKELVKLWAIFGSGLLIGGGAAYFGLKNHYKRISDEEVESVKASFRRLYKEGEENSLDSLAAKYADNPDVDTSEEALAKDRADIQRESVEAFGEPNMGNYVTATTNYNTREGGVKDARALVADILSNAEQKDSIREASDNPVNVFEEYPEVNTDEDDLGPRGPEAPYVISLDEFMDDDAWDRFANISLTYFEEDDVLIDDREITVDDLEMTIGRASLDYFGKGSEDKDMVYVRNDATSVQYEVTRDKRSYTEVVLGVKVDPERQNLRKMRDDE